MAEEHITPQMIRTLLSYDASTGVLTWMQSCGQRRKGSVAGSLQQNGYIQLTINGRHYKAHRIIWMHVHQEWPRGQIDHINGIRNDNRLCNLRDVTNIVNSQNIRKPHKDNRRGWLGISWNKRDKRWVASIGSHRKKRHLGMFKTPEEASRAYWNAKHVLHEEAMHE